MARSSWRRVITPAVMLMASLALLPGLTAPRSAAAPPAGAPLLIAAGDIDGCGAGQDTARIIDGTDGVVAPLGDNAYPNGSASDYAQCYDPTWGRFKDRTRPVPGNHDYDNPNAPGYFGYFGAAAGPAGKGYYSYDVGAWHIVALNSNCDVVDCTTEGAWLNDDLTAHAAPCILAYWHHPRYSSGSAGDNPMMNDFWKVLYDHDASVVLSGHDHDYERFAPQDAAGHTAPGRGIREFIVGTGGGAPGSLYGADPNSELRNNRTFGVLELTLRPDGYDWRFVPVSGSRFSDAGSAPCSGAPPAVPAPPSTTPAGGAPPAPAATTTSGPAAEAPAPAPSSSPVTTSTPAGTAATRPSPPRVVAAAPTPRPATAHQTAAPPLGSPPPSPTSAPPAAPAAPAGRGNQTANGPPADIGGPAADSASPTGEVPLPVVIAGLIHAPPRPPGDDRRGAATVALILMLADAAGLAALHRGRPGRRGDRLRGGLGGQAA